MKSALEIALEKHERHEHLSKITEEFFEHVALLEECWDAIGTPRRSSGPEPRPVDRKAA